MPPKKPATSITSHTHADRRANIPTEELRDFIIEDEQSPKTLLYPRDPSLDPQLVWQGKDEQDAGELSVPAVPIYIQEKIHPQAIIDDLLLQAARPGSGVKEAAAAYQLNMFADFNGGPVEFDQKLEFYQHEQNWANRLILGDSLLVMASLAEKEGLRGKVQTIYIDPPYGIKFGSNWQVSTRKRDVKDGRAEDATRQPEQIRAFRDTWKLGIHSYLAYLRDRLAVARDLLTETGSVFVQIGDENVHLVRCVLDEVFGSENYIASIASLKTSGKASEYLDPVYDSILWYGKTSKIKYRQLFKWKVIGEEGTTQYVSALTKDGKERRLSIEEIADPSQIPDGFRIFASDNLTSQSASLTTLYEYEFNGKRFNPGKGGWKTNLEGMKNLEKAGRLKPIGNTLMYRRFFNDFPVSPINNIWRDVLMTGFSEEKVYVVQTSTKIIERCILMTTDPGDLVLDPTCGSGTTAYVAEQWGRRWITIDTSRVALALARTRLMAGRFPYYLLADSYEGQKKARELNPQIAQMGADAENNLRKSASSADASPSPDIKKGFVYKRVPHVTLKSIANNPDIHPGMSRAEIDAAIARHADTETLYDRPYEDSGRVRVCGPFSVESLSPHRVLSTGAEAREGAAGEQEAHQQHDFVNMILDNLKKAGVQNTRKNERLAFDRLDPYPGAWLHAAGEYSDTDGKTRRAAVSIGPEHGTVGPQQVKEAAMEAVQGIPFDLLIVCGFAFDPHVSEEVKRYGKLTVLPAKMNPDLAMGDELLKKTGAGNLFMVFGEPDVEIRRIQPQMTQMNAEQEKYSLHQSADLQSGEQIVVEIKGVDVYDPTTGQIRNSSTDDIACWFIDTDYNGESFFVRHAYFTGAEEPYERLKRALRAEINEEAWSALYSTVSRPFPRPERGKIAVKVINHYGDEVLKVFTL